MVSRFAAWALVAGLMMAPLGCGEESFPSVEAGKLRLFEDEFRMGPVRETHLFVVEGSEDLTAAELRRRFARDFVEAEGYRWDEGGGAGRTDPAGWRPLHRIGVFAFPTQAGPVLLGPASSSEELVQVTNSVKREQVTRWSEAVAERIIAPPPEGTNAVLAALADATELLTGAREPNTAEERALVELLVPRSELVVWIVSSREDESSRAPEDYALKLLQPLGTFSLAVLGAAVLPSGADECLGSGCPATPRFQAWARASQDVDPVLWNPSALAERLIPRVSSDVNPKCLPPPRRLENGQAACALTVESTEADSAFSCEGERGFIQTSQPNVCEVRQIEGRALESCKKDLDCAECEAGFCFTELPEAARVCREGRVPRPRLVAPSGEVTPPLRFRLVCEENTD